MTGNSLTSPIGHYRPELLMLAPESGEDLNTKSLVSQFLELGVALELDGNWHLPTVPPKDLSAYRVVIMPETARERYDADLNAYYRAGGYIYYLKYYPVGPPPARFESKAMSSATSHGFYISYGRDAYFFHIANMLLEGGLTLDEPDFRRTMERRSIPSLIAEYRVIFFDRFGERDVDRWERWGDVAATQFINNALLAERLGDTAWLDLIDYCREKVVDAIEGAISGHYTENKELPDTSHIGLTMMGAFLMDRGHHRGDSRLVDAGVRLVRRYVDLADTRDGVLREKTMRFNWSESLIPTAGLYWYARLTGDAAAHEAADTLMRVVSEGNLRADGLWHHWTDGRGGKGAVWSRGLMWAMLYYTLSLRALDPASPSAAYIRERVGRLYAGLRRYQDAESGLWHLVVDEPSRRESSGTAGLIYCHDRLREMGVTLADDDPMFDRAFLGLKRLSYRGGVASNCRGTATGTADYYRTRPLGYVDTTLFPSALATRLVDG